MGRIRLNPETGRYENVETVIDYESKTPVVVPSKQPKQPKQKVVQESEPNLEVITSGAEPGFIERNADTLYDITSAVAPLSAHAIENNWGTKGRLGAYVGDVGINLIGMPVKAGRVLGSTLSKIPVVGKTANDVISFLPKLGQKAEQGIVSIIPKLKANRDILRTNAQTELRALKLEKKNIANSGNIPNDEKNLIVSKLNKDIKKVESNIDYIDNNYIGATLGNVIRNEGIRQLDKNVSRENINNKIDKLINWALYE